MKWNYQSDNFQLVADSFLIGLEGVKFSVSMGKILL